MSAVLDSSIHEWFTDSRGCTSEVSRITKQLALDCSEPSKIDLLLPQTDPLLIFPSRRRRDDCEILFRIPYHVKTLSLCSRSQGAFCFFVR